jgi:hypothetical protein
MTFELELAPHRKASAAARRAEIRDRPIKNGLSCWGQRPPFREQIEEPRARGRQTPRSVTSALTSRVGVTSKAWFATGLACGVTRAALSFAARAFR